MATDAFNLKQTDFAATREPFHPPVPAATLHRAEIDGLRFVAVLPVILFHAGFTAFSGGFVGVDIFFVISGFLISRILIGEIGAGRFSLVDFYERRARRILPAMTVMALVCVPLAWLWMGQSAFADFSTALMAVAVFSSNILFWRTADYFGPDQEANPLLHTWTMSVEEQFYLLFPLFLMLFLPRGRRLTFVAIGALVTVSLLVSHWGATAKPEPTFYLLPTRAWELGIGVIAAFLDVFGWIPLRRRLWNETLSGLGLAAIVASIFLYDSHLPFPSFYTLLPTLGAAAILLFARPGTTCHWLLSRRFPVFIGLISYSAYLWHQPVFAFARINGLEGTGVFTLLTLASLGVAYLSWRFVEQPFRDRQRFGRASVFLLSAIGTVGLLAIGKLGLLMPSVQGQVYHHFLTAQEIENDRLIQRYTVVDEAATLVDDGECRFPVWSVDQHFLTRFKACEKRFGPALMVMGDSHAQNLYDAIALRFPDPFIVGAVRAACRPYQEQPQCEYKALAKFVDENSGSIKRVIYHQSGSYLFLDDRGYPDSDLGFRPGRRIFFDVAAFDKVAGYLDQLAERVPVVWVGAFGEFRDRVDIVRLQDQAFSPEKLKRFDWLEQEMSRALGKRLDRRFEYRPLHPKLKSLYGPIVSGDCLRVRDKDHWSRCGEQELGGLLLDGGFASARPMN